MDLLVKAIYDEVEELNEKGVRLETIGNTSILPVSCREALAKAKDKTKDNNKITLILALSYSSRWEIAQAVKTIAEESFRVNWM